MNDSTFQFFSIYFFIGIALAHVGLFFFWKKYKGGLFSIKEKFLYTIFLWPVSSMFYLFVLIENYVSFIEKLKKAKSKKKVKAK